MKIRLLANDSKIPNIAIMKISTYHKKIGDDVDWYNPTLDFIDTDILYHSQIFTFTKPYLYYPLNAKIIKGGTGIDIYSKLPKEIEEIKELDYSLYPNCDFSLQFLSRGCIRNCDFCVVRKKEGLIHKVEAMSLNPNGKYIKLLDNNFFACKEWRENIEILKSYNQPIDFNQGIDLRILNEEQCIALSQLKIKNIHFAWDNYKDKDVILPKIDLLTKYIKPNKLSCYVLVGFEDKEIVGKDLERVMTLWTKYKITPFAMGYVNYSNPNYKKSDSVLKFCRWCNHHLYKICSWEDYDSSYRSKNKIKQKESLF